MQFHYEDILYSKKRKQEGFDFNKLAGPGIYNLLYESDLQSLYNIATSIKYAANLEKKYSAIEEIMKPRGFAHFHRGTNRTAYKYYENPNILVKVPVDKAGCTDGIREFQNQWLLEPFVTKVFDVHPSGVSVHERVIPMTSYLDFARFATEYFKLVSHVFIGRFVMDDIGEKSFMNWGFRIGFGLVLLDFPYLYELDYQKLVCKQIDPRTNQICYGQIDYDDGFNELRCTNCGRTYHAKDLAGFWRTQEIDLKEEEIMGTIKTTPHLILRKGGEVVGDFTPKEGRMQSNTIAPKHVYDNANKLQHKLAPKKPEAEGEVILDKNNKPIRSALRPLPKVDLVGESNEKIVAPIDSTDENAVAMADAINEKAKTILSNIKEDKQEAEENTEPQQEEVVEQEPVSKVEEYLGNITEEQKQEEEKSNEDSSKEVEVSEEGFREEEPEETNQPDPQTDIHSDTQFKTLESYCFKKIQEGMSIQDLSEILQGSDKISEELYVQLMKSAKAYYHKITNEDELPAIQAQTLVEKEVITDPAKVKEILTNIAKGSISDPNAFLLLIEDVNSISGIYRRELRGLIDDESEDQILRPQVEDIDLFISEVVNDFMKDNDVNNLYLKYKVARGY